MTNQAALREQILTLTRQYTDKQVKKLFIAGESYIPVSGKLIDSNDISMLVDACLDGWLTTGRYNKAFEQRLGQWLGVEHVLTTVSGSAANLLAFTALTSPKLQEKAIRAGDEVITVAAGFPTTVNPIIQNQAIPVFVDVNPHTLNIDVNLLEQALSERTRAVMIAHTLGNPFDLAAVRSFCDQHGLWLIEDCCDALGSTYQGSHVGSFGDVATLSFYPAHHITTGEGGAVFTRSKKLAKIVESFRDWGRDCYCKPGEDNTCKRRFYHQLGELPQGYDHKYIYSHIGYNLKITDMQAACGLSQMDKLASFCEKRRHNFNYLASKLSHVDGLEIAQATQGSNPSWFGIPLTLSGSLAGRRTLLLRELEQAKIGTRLLFAGNLTKQPYFKGVNYRIATRLIHTDNVMFNTFWLGVHPSLDTTMLDYMADTLVSLCRRLSD
ncbi:lipopolysaccharide biosynthesis protein RfbH [Shewanella xiamenensis]|uniref:lipopolysaccharide biosynthesis protein RfbH n=1 Tax=Shewanella xiamenensis TaxID=332186 RepID=UPI001C4EA87C|nr:lipopolysaccharide biosynthesis protein RfbH [Shewanella xiamenensis]MBW0278031.1 lipopolysaccharide biosynthesis protein RfbH [Shewanella xiamenensis]MCT8872520.1 lipopolysaccharide biosynthesis protein RfbH [Shewanella xiamenensis]UWH43350.1 lipopolysaccharide biosynthesis protein RfbH [Shewanella xiamenensis]